MRIAKNWLFALLLAVFMAGCGSGGGVDGGGPAPALDTTAPTVASTNPVDTSTGLATNSKITATFSEAVAPASCTIATFTLAGVAGTVSCVGRTAIFTPTGGPLAISTLYTATVGKSAVVCSEPLTALTKSWTPIEQRTLVAFSAPHVAPLLHKI